MTDQDIMRKWAEDTFDGIELDRQEDFTFEEWNALAVVAAGKRDEMRGVALSSWRAFTPGDVSTYPPNNAGYWATWKNGRMERQHFDVDSPFVDVLWRYCTHWAEVVPPESLNASS